MTHLRIGTRGSDLALWQADFVSRRLRELRPGLTCEPVTIKTHGDQAADDTFDPVAFLAERQSRLADLKNTVTANPNDADALFELGETYMIGNDWPNAILWFQRLVAVQPDMGILQRVLQAQALQHRTDVGMPCIAKHINGEVLHLRKSFYITCRGYYSRDKSALHDQQICHR